MLSDFFCQLTTFAALHSSRSNLSALHSSRSNLSAHQLNLSSVTDAGLHEDAGALCDDHWTWSGVANFWQEEETSGIDIRPGLLQTERGHHDKRGTRTSRRGSRHESAVEEKQVRWRILRSGAPSATGTVTALQSPGQPCRPEDAVEPHTAVVVVPSRDRFSLNVWHRMTSIFEAWVAPKVLQIKGKLPENISIAYHVPPLEQSNVENDPGPFPWKLLGSVTEKDCGFEHWIQAPEDGFLWDLAWDLPLNCVHSSNLWRDFQSALYDSVGLVAGQDSGGRSVCYVGRPGADSARQLSDKSYNALKAAARAVKLDGEPLAFLTLDFDGSVPTAQQAETVSRCDVLIGLHGAGMSHSIWMYPGSVVVEIMDDEHLGAAYYRNIAHLSGHVYFKHDKRELEGRPQLFKQLMVTAAEIISNKATYSRKVSSELPALLAKAKTSQKQHKSHS